MRWLVIDERGKTVKGQGPRSGLVNILKTSIASVFSERGRIVMADGPIDLLYTVDVAMSGGPQKRSWGFKSLADQRLWILPDTTIGFARSIEGVERVRQLLNNHGNHP